MAAPAKSKRPKNRTEIRFRKGFPNRGVDAKDAKRQIDQIAKRRGNGSQAIDGEVLYEETLDKPQTPCGRIIFYESDESLVRRARISIADDTINAIQTVRVRVMGGEEVETVERCYIGYTEEEEEWPGKVYAPRNAVLSEQGRRESVIEDALSSLMGWVRRYQDISELRRIGSAIERYVRRYREEQ